MSVPEEVYNTFIHWHQLHYSRGQHMPCSTKSQ